jgi:uncharacterized protein (TIGR03067 family)
MQLDGTWLPVAANVSGQVLAIAQLRVSRLIIESATYRILDHRAHVVDCGALELDEAAMPCALDLIGLEGPHAGKCMRAIIELDGDRLCVCYDLEQELRPRSMRPLGDQLLLSITYARAAAPRHGH